MQSPQPLPLPALHRLAPGRYYGWFIAAGLAAMSSVVVGIGYRLLPMVLPAAPPRGRGVAASALLLEAGVLGLFLSLFFRAGWWTGVAGATIAAGFVVFLLHVMWMLRRPRPAPVARRRPDYAVRHAMIALACLNMSLSVEEAIAAATLNAACSLGLQERIGSLEPGKAADIVVLDIPSYLHLAYQPGINHVHTVVKAGQLVVQDGRVSWENGTENPPDAP